MIRAAAFLALALPAAAQDRSDEIAEQLDEVMAEYRVYLTCSSLDPEVHAPILAMWKKMVGETQLALAEAGLAPANLGDFIASGWTGGLTPEPGTPFADVQSFCAKHPGWLRAFDSFSYTRLPDALDLEGDTP